MTTTEWTTTRPMFPPSATDPDPDTGAQYVTVGIGPVAFTVQASDTILIDYDQHGLPVGVEILL
jgi:uncharacterized protein YuzE